MLPNDSLLTMLLYLMGYNVQPPSIMSYGENDVQKYIIELLKNNYTKEERHIVFSKQWIDRNEKSGYEYKARRGKYIYYFVIPDKKVDDE